MRLMAPALSFGPHSVGAQFSVNGLSLTGTEPCPFTSPVTASETAHTSTATMLIVRILICPPLGCSRCRESLVLMPRRLADGRAVATGWRWARPAERGDGYKRRDVTAGVQQRNDDQARSRVTHGVM